MDENRIEYIDQIKGIAIFLVVMGHAIAWTYEDYTVLLDNSPKYEMFWFYFIYAFHMPLFFWASGFLFPKELSSVKLLRQLIWKRAYSLLLPFIFSGSIIYCIRGGGGYY